MNRFTRLIALAVMALAAVFSVQAASAQMMHDVVYIVVETSDGSNLERGEVCISGETEEVCQEIPAGTPSGREFEFDGVADGEHTISAAAGEWWRPVERTVNVNESGLVFTLVLEPLTNNLPDTGAGATVDATASLAGALLAGASLFAGAATSIRRAAAR